MRNTRDWDVSDLEKLCNIKAEESSDLEFKRSASLNNTPQNKEELCKDVSAMANAAGGIIVYGIAEGSLGEADHIDNGCSPSDTKVEWIDQVLNSGIEPRISELSITSISLANGNKCFAIEIAQATVFAPHQSRMSKKYFKRTERRVEAMLDYEIRDIFRRATTPYLYIQLSPLQKPDGLYLECNIGNKSNEPSLYTIVQFMFDKELGIESLPYGEALTHEVMISNLNNVPSFARPILVKMAIPGFFPIFKEVFMNMFQVPIKTESNKIYPFIYTISCPGFRSSQTGRIMTLNGNVLVEYVS